MSTVTVARLHKYLSKMIADGKGRRPVCVRKDSFWSPLEDDGVVILDVTGVEEQWVPQADDDGWAAINKDGTERGRACLVLDGGMKEPKP